jgi:hypothetical protein
MVLNFQQKTLHVFHMQWVWAKHHRALQSSNTLLACWGNGLAGGPTLIIHRNQRACPCVRPKSNVDDLVASKQAWSHWVLVPETRVCDHWVMPLHTLTSCFGKVEIWCWNECPKWWCLRNQWLFFGVKFAFFRLAAGNHENLWGGKTFLLGQIHNTVMGFGHPFTIMKNLNGQLLHIHRSTDIRVSVDDEHLAIHSHTNLFPSSPCCFMILNVFGG